MGAAASSRKAPGATEGSLTSPGSDGATDNSKDVNSEEAHAGSEGGALAEVGALLKAYQIESADDLMRMDAKYHSLKATGAHGFGLLQGLHMELHKMHTEKESKMHMADVVAQARERVNFLMRQISAESFNNYVCCVDGSPQSDHAYEVGVFSCMLPMR